MKDVLALKKSSPALQLSLQLTRLAATIAIDNLTADTFRDLLLDQPQEILSHVKNIDVDAVSDTVYDQICRIVESAEYDPGQAARESEAGFFLDLDTILTRLRRDLEAAHNESRRLLPTTSFCIGVDGSRQSYVAFEVTTRLRRQGHITVVHVDEEQGAHSIQLPVISSDFVVDEYTAHGDRLRLPGNRIAVQSVKHDAPSSSVASELLDVCEKLQADFLVLGTIGKGGPAIDQLGHVPRNVLQFTPLPVLLVPPAPIHSIPTPRSMVFVVAMGSCSPVARRCLHALLKLFKPRDSVRIVHFYKPPVVGSYDVSRFAFCNDFLTDVRINDGVVEILALEHGSTIAESLHEYIATHRASYLVLGLHGDGLLSETAAQHQREEDDETRDHGHDQDLQLENAIGRVTAAMLFSPRCTLCICP